MTVRVVDVLNALQRFPGKASITVDGDVTVDGVSIVQGGTLKFTPRKGTKGAGAAGASVVAPRIPKSK